MNLELLLNIYLWGLIPAGVLAGIIWEYTERTKHYVDAWFLLGLVTLVVIWPIWLLLVISNLFKK